MTLPYAQINIVQEFTKYVTLLKFISQNGDRYFEEIEELTDNFKRSIKKVSFNKDTLTEESIKQAVAKASDLAELNINEADSYVREYESVDTPILSVDTEIESVGLRLTSVSDRASAGYNEFIDTTATTGNATHDAAIKLMSAILKYEQDILKERGVKKYAELAYGFLEQILADESLISKEDLQEVYWLSDDLQEYLDDLHLNHNGSFSADAYFDKILKEALKSYDAIDKAKVFSSEEKAQVQNILAQLRLHENELPEDVKKYRHIYNTNDIDYLLTDEVVDTNALLDLLVSYEVPKQRTKIRVASMVLSDPVPVGRSGATEPTGQTGSSSNLPTGVSTAISKLSQSAKDLTAVLAGGSASSITQMAQVVLEATGMQESLPDTAKQILAGIDDFAGFKEALLNGTPQDLAPYCSQLKEIITSIKDAGDLSQIPQQLLGSLADLPTNIGEALAGLKDFSGEKVMDVVDGLLGMKDTIASIDPSLSGMLNALPDDIRNLNGNNLVEMLGVNTQLSDIFQRIGVLDAIGSLPTSVADLTKDLPPEISNILNTLGDMTGVNNLMGELSGMLDLGTITQPVQDIIDNALGSLSVGGVVDALKSGDISKIVDVSSGLSGIMDGLGSLSDIPAKLVEGISGIPDKIGDIVDNIGGLVDNLDMNSLLDSGLVQMGAQALVQMLPPEAQKVVEIASTVLSALGFDFGLGGLFGGGALGSPVPRPWW